MRRDVAPRVVATRNDGRRHQRHPPVLGLQLGRLERRPDRQHALAGEARAHLGEAKVKREPRREDLGRQVPRQVGDVLEVAVRVGRVGQAVEQRLDGGHEGGRDVAHLFPVERRRLRLDDCLEDVGLPVEQGLPLRRGLACRDKNKLFGSGADFLL